MDSAIPAPPTPPMIGTLMPVSVMRGTTLWESRYCSYPLKCRTLAVLSLPIRVTPTLLMAPLRAQQETATRNSINSATMTVKGSTLTPLTTVMSSLLPQAPIKAIDFPLICIRYIFTNLKLIPIPPDRLSIHFYKGGDHIKKV